MKIKVRNYVIIGELPDGCLVYVRHRLLSRTWEKYHGQIEQIADTELHDRYPTARVARGGAGWSDDYEEEV